MCIWGRILMENKLLVTVLVPQGCFKYTMHWVDNSIWNFLSYSWWLKIWQECGWAMFSPEAPGKPYLHCFLPVFGGNAWHSLAWGCKSPISALIDHFNRCKENFLAKFNFSFFIKIPWRIKEQEEHTPTWEVLHVIIIIQLALYCMGKTESICTRVRKRARVSIFPLLLNNSKK